MTRSGSRQLADFDSATAMLRALAAFLHGRDFRDLGLSSASRPMAVAANWLPLRARQQVYKLGGYFEAIAPEKLSEVRDEEIAAAVAEQYPRRRYPAVFVGSSNGRSSTSPPRSMRLGLSGPAVVWACNSPA